MTTDHSIRDALASIKAWQERPSDGDEVEVLWSRVKQAVEALPDRVEGVTPKEFSDLEYYKALCGDEVDEARECHRQRR